MSGQANSVYYQNMDSTEKVATTDPSQVHFNPYSAPLPNAPPMPYPPAGEAYIQPPPPYPNMWGPMQANQQNLNHIRDYMVWSVINICIGGVLFGLIAVLFSYMTIRRKQRQEIQAARRWSRITLIYNILVDLMIAILIIIIIIVYAIRARNAYIYTY